MKHLGTYRLDPYMIEHIDLEPELKAKAPLGNYHGEHHYFIDGLYIWVGYVMTCPTKVAIHWRCAFNAKR